MSTLEVRAPRALPARVPAGLARFFARALSVIEVFAEAQRLAHEAQRRHRYAAE